LEDYIKSYHSTAGSQYRREIFLRFDLTSCLSPYLDSAILRLYADLTEAHTLNLFPVTKSEWVEDDLNANNKIEKAGEDVTTIAATASTSNQGMGAKYYEWNVRLMLLEAFDKGESFIAFRIREGNVVTTPAGDSVVVNWHSKENGSGNYPHIQYVEQDVSMARLQAMFIDGALVDGFLPSKYKYFVSLAWDAMSVPVVTAIPVYTAARVTVTPARNLNGSESERTTKVAVNNNNLTLTYSVVFDLLPPPTIADLSSILADGKPILPFDKDETFYTLHVPHGWTESTLFSAQTVDPFASYTLQLPVNLGGTESERTCMIMCTSANGMVKKQYRVLINRLPEMEIVLAMGQSQMGGRADYSEEGTNPIPNVWLLNSGNFVELATNPMNRYASISKDPSIEALSPAFAFVNSVEQALKRPLGIMLNAQGGSSITTWYQPGTPNYDASMIRIREMAKYGNVVGIIWHQGSADNSAGQADNFASYKSRFKTMVDNFRRELNLPRLLFICGELTDGRPEFDDFNEIVIHDVQNYISDSDYVIADGVTLMPDGIHFDTPRSKTLILNPNPNPKS
jgi:hypothetical protein